MRQSGLVGTARRAVRRGFLPGRSPRRGDPTIPRAALIDPLLPASARAFTLIEVMVATTIFFMAMFSILGVLCAGIHAATLLRASGPTAGMAAGYYFVTNKIVEGGDGGDFSDIAGYQGYVWRSTAVEVATNGLFKMEFVVIDPRGNPSSVLDVLIYNPTSSSGNKMGLQPTPH